MRFGMTTLVAAILLAGGAAQAQPTTPTASVGGSSPPPAPSVCCLIPSGTPLEIELVEPVSSRTAHSDDMFDIRLAADLVVDGRKVLSAGARGRGQVVDTAPAGIAGRPGKLVLAARYLDQGPAHIPLRGFKLSGTGRDDSKTSMAVYLAIGVVGLAAQGGNIDFPAGTRAMAKVAADTPVPLPDTTGASPPAPADGSSAPSKEKN